MELPNWTRALPQPEQSWLGWGFRKGPDFGDTSLVEFWDHVERLASALGQTSYFEILELEPTAAAIELTDAYHKALCRYHPDRHLMTANPARQRQLAQICARIGEAYRVLSKQKTRLAYIAGLKEGDTRQRTKRTTLNERRDPKTEKTRQLLASARQLFNRGNRSGAKAKLGLALQFEPDSAALAALRDEMEPAPSSSAKVESSSETESQSDQDVATESGGLSS